MNLAGLLAEPERLRVVAAVTLGARTVEDVCAATGLAPREAWRCLRRLRRGGLVSTVDGGFAVAYDAIKAAARAAAPEPEDVGAADPATAAVLRAFVRDGRLVSVPAARSKRRVVLEHLAMAFEPGVRYAEAEVNVVLRAWHPDHAALRRYLVDEGFLGRERGEYWRTGGRVEL
ncbi:MAG TPA: DUF2087 domain-containing protein [Mycobacteriales bacterium]